MSVSKFGKLEVGQFDPFRKQFKDSRGRGLVLGREDYLLVICWGLSRYHAVIVTTVYMYK